MTSEQRERLASYRAGKFRYYDRDDYENDLEDEREAVVKILSAACNSASNPGAHRLALKCLQAMGERVPERKEGR